METKVKSLTYHPHGSTARGLNRRILLRDGTGRYGRDGERERNSHGVLHYSVLLKKMYYGIALTDQQGNVVRVVRSR
jgi:hypothetical protein